MSYIKNPSSIEQTSFTIIQSVIDKEHSGYQFETEMQESIIKRAIHTTGDFDYLYTLRFTHGAIEAIANCLKQKGTLILDSSISLNGINKRVLDQMSVSYRCLAEESWVLEKAEQAGRSASLQAIDELSTIEGPKVLAFGDSPEALDYAVSAIQSGRLTADAILGMPVGFVEVDESKKALESSSIPAIINRGPKGGTTIVVSTINAILYQLKTVATEDYVRYSTPTAVEKEN